MESNFLEKDLEDIIFENKNKIHERGLPVLYEELERQRDIKGKRIDLFNYECVGDDSINFTIFELKKDKIDFNAYAQIVQYFFEECVFFKKHKKILKANLVLIGKDFDESVLLSCILSDIIDIYVYKYDYDGIRFQKVSKGYTEFMDIIADKNL